MSTPSDKTLRLERTKLTPQPPRGGRNQTLIMAIIAGVAAAVLMGVYLTQVSNKPAPPPKTVYVNQPAPPPQQPVVLADEDIALHTVITPAMLKPGTADPGKIAPNAAATMQEVVGQATLIPIKKGDQVTRDEYGPNNEALQGLAPLIPPVSVAVTIKLDPQSSVNGFIKPNDHVDVYGTFTNGHKSVTKPVLQNVLLLATGGEAIQATAPPPPPNNGGLLASNQQQAPEQQPAAAKPQENIQNATLALHPSDAEKVILAQSKGTLTLALRRNTDNLIKSIPTIEDKSVTGLPPDTVAAAAPAPPVFHLPPPPPQVIQPMAAPAPTTSQITVIKGDNVTTPTVPLQNKI